MRAFVFIVTTIGLLAGGGPTMADQPATRAPVKPIIELGQLAALGRDVAAIRYESGNVFRYSELRDALHKIGKSMEGGRVEFVAQVMRVTEKEVVVELLPAGKTQIVLMHSAAPVYGNLRTVTYPGPSSTRRIQMFSGHVGLRIGSEITLEMAKTLHRRDMLVLQGTIDSLPVSIDSVFAPTAVALISDWTVLGLISPLGY